MSKRSDESVISQSFFSRAKEAGKLGCIIDLSQKKQNSSLASMFFKATASFFDTVFVRMDKGIEKNLPKIENVHSSI